MAVIVKDIFALEKSFKRGERRRDLFACKLLLEKVGSAVADAEIGRLKGNERKSVNSQTSQLST